LARELALFAVSRLSKLLPERRNKTKKWHRRRQSRSARLSESELPRLKKIVKQNRNVRRPSSNDFRRLELQHRSRQSRERLSSKDS
jgi:hypothetical protein